MFEDVVSSINSFGSFSQQHISLLLDCLKTQIVLKDDCLVREGQVCQAFYFVSQGSFRHYTIQENGMEATLNLFISNEWLF
ncbi:MAG: cyclic nucleotide-binding domain-containing protein [Williamsia sp.]|nr:cyclic nucleotide-binding domain-containing protein [Williamsia sp.]